MRRFAVISLLALSSACSNSEPFSPSLRVSGADLTPLHQTLYSNIREPRRMLIRDANTWAALWPDLMTAGDPETPPFVDFSREDVLVATMGERRAGGYSIDVSEVRVLDTGATAVITSTVPAAGCDGAEVITAPSSAVRIRKVTGTLAFEERTLVPACS